MAYLANQPERCKKYFIFLFRDTYVERQPGEKQNDRNDRAIRKAASWYESHLSEGAVGGKFPKVVLLTDDENNRKIAQEEGTVCCTGKYLHSAYMFLFFNLCL